MKNTIFILIVLLSITSCHPQKSIIDPKSSTALKPEKNDEGEWELIVYDSRYEYFLNAIARPRSMYSEDGLKSRNIFLVNEWNSHYFSGKHANVIESSIDYNPQEKYGFEFEYRLYQVFAYTSWNYGIKFQNLNSIDIR